MVAFTFGLIHSFGFAGTLVSASLPRSELPLARASDITAAPSRIAEAAIPIPPVSHVDSFEISSVHVRRFVMTKYQRVTVDGNKIFYREAGPTVPHGTGNNLARPT